MSCKDDPSELEARREAARKIAEAVAEAKAWREAAEKEDRENEE